MTIAHSFTVPGVPVPLLRARVVRRGGLVRSYTPEKSAEYIAVVRGYAYRSGAPKVPGGVPVALTIEYVLPWPKSLSKAKRALTGGLHVKKPDLSNLTKGVEDALNGLAWEDDGQVCVEYVVKVYGDEPKAVISYRAIESNESGIKP